MARISRAQRQANRERLLAVFGRQVEGTARRPPTVSSVSAEAGIARSAFYNYFADIEELFRCYVDGAIADLATSIADALDDLDDPIAELKAFVELTLAAFVSHRTAFTAAIDLGLDRNLESTEDLAPIHGVIARILAGGTACGRFDPLAGDPLVPEMILRSIGTHHRRIALGEVSAADAAPTVTRFVLNALGALDRNDADPVPTPPQPTRSKHG